jgi:hypothetical protein
MKRRDYLPALRFDGPLPQFGNYYRVDARFWKNPANARQFLDGVAWARNGEAWSITLATGTGRRRYGDVPEPQRLTRICR